MTESQFRPILWESSHLSLLDQRILPARKEFLKITTLEDTISSIRNMAVRGAPAIAIAGMFGLVLFAKSKFGKLDSKMIQKAIQDVFESRPTAVNLSYALKQAKEIADTFDTFESLASAWENYAMELFKIDYESNLQLGKFGTTLFDLSKSEFHIITHCNTGALATAGHGTALGVIRSLRDLGKKVVVYADETRPFLQGSRLTAFEMMEEGIECFIITDGMSGWLMDNKSIDAVLVGCDRVAKNGDTANKIGTYNLALVAQAHQVPFYVCATKDSFDLRLATGKDIPIEMRSEEEVTRFDFLKSESGSYIIPEGKTAPIGARALNPSFDITKENLITSFITEFGCFKPNEIEIRLNKV